MRNITLSVENLILRAGLNEANTARKIHEALPLEGSIRVWGDEIYLEIPLAIDLEADAHEHVEVGELGYWPQGPAFCIFFGPTPVSMDESPRAYSPANVIVRMLVDPKALKAVVDGAVNRVTPHGCDKQEPSS